MAATTIVAVHTQRRILHDPLALWHLLSLDAPTVAALWTGFAAASFHVALPWPAPLALAFAVWILYAADRLSDARLNLAPLEERHRFHARHRLAFTLAICFAVPILAALLFWMPSTLRSAWLLLAVPMMGYVAAVHAVRLRVPKEAMVGLFFAAAVAMPCLVQQHSFALLTIATMFGGLCWLNCVLIARSEQADPNDMDRLTAWAIHHFRNVLSTFAILAFSMAVCIPSARGMSVAIAAASLLLLLADVLKKHFSAVRMRALTDAALLTPLFIWPLLAHLR